MIRRKTVYVLLGLWVLVQIWSFWASAGIEGPRNLDTGFKRLDTLFKWQVVALVIAVFSGIAGFLEPGKRWLTRVIGLVPAIITLTVVGGIALFATFHQGIESHSDPAGTPKTTAPAIESNSQNQSRLPGFKFKLA